MQTTNGKYEQMYKEEVEEDDGTRLGAGHQDTTLKTANLTLNHIRFLQNKIFDFCINFFLIRIKIILLY